MGKTLVTFFSASGVTANVAKVLAEAVSADLKEIKAEVPYTKEDLDYMNPQSRSSVEMKDKSSRPAIIKEDVDMAAYDTVFLGFPIWWATAPTIVNTYLESYDFSGKKIILFATCGSSGFGTSLADIQALVPAAEVVEGKILSAGQAADEIKVLADCVK